MIAQVLQILYGRQLASLHQGPPQQVLAEGLEVSQESESLARAGMKHFQYHSFLPQLKKGSYSIF